MAIVWRNALILVFAHFVLSQTRMQCDKPPTYEDKQLRDKYLSKSVFNDQDGVFYKCLQGYEPSSGSGISICEGGEWTPLSLICQKKKCNALGEIENGQYIREGRSFGDKAFAKCNQGYDLRGESVRVCLENGWNGTDPICESQFVTASLSTVHIPKTCPVPALGKNGTVVNPKSSYAVGETLSVKCNDGFTESREYKCRPNLKWHPKEPKCQIHISKTCPVPALGKNGTVVNPKSSYAVGETLSVKCNEGFTESREYKCRPNLKWHPKEPKCQSKKSSRPGKCGPAPSHPNAFLRDGSPMLEEYLSGVRIRYKCDIGFYRAAGSDFINCQGGRWTKPQLKCQRKSCGSAGEISFGRFQYTGVLFGDSATAVCQEGYELSGPAVRICRDGGWDGRNPECEPVHCPPPPEVKDAEISDFRHEHVPFSHVVYYRCLTGALIGARDIYCTKRGTWSSPPPECRDITCPHPHVPQGSRMRGFRSVYKFGNTVTITCSPGWRLVGESFSTCGADGKWRPNLPQCQRLNNLPDRNDLGRYG